jgi:transcriptional regulator with XRE-family HTH domain
MTGADLRVHRKAAGLSQIELARRAGVGRQAVQYWERKAEADTRRGAPRRFCKALGLPHYYTPNARARAWGLTRPDLWLACAGPAGRQPHAICAPRSRAPNAKGTLASIRTR